MRARPSPSVVVAAAFAAWASLVLGQDAGTPEPYDVVVLTNVMVPMRDGVRLATDVYLPARDGKPVEGGRSR